MPCTGVFVRTSVNTLNGATHPIAQLMNAVFVLVCPCTPPRRMNNATSHPVLLAMRCICLASPRIRLNTFGPHAWSAKIVTAVAMPLFEMLPLASVTCWVMISGGDEREGLGRHYES